MASPRIPSSVAARQRRQPGALAGSNGSWKFFSIDKHELVAIPRTEWRDFLGESSVGLHSRAVGFVRIMGVRHVLVSNEDLQLASSAAPAITAVLTSRELQITHFVAEGKCDKVIAHELGISEYTVREHMRRIFHKLKVSKRAALVARMIGQLLEGKGVGWPGGARPPSGGGDSGGKPS